MSKTIRERLSFLQKNLKVEKGQKNKFGGYSYRSSEDILEALKPLLEEDETVTVDEEMKILAAEGQVRFYKESTAIFSKGMESISKKSQTREDDSQKGMSLGQLSGSVGSYGKKYALGNLFAIDDTKDADATNDHGKAPAKSPVKKAAKKEDKPTSKKPSGNSFAKKKVTKKVEEEEEL